jgi:cytidylate kinase
VTDRSNPVVAIDGPAGAGKSTCARLVAKELGFVLVDTGAIYRGVALAARDEGVDWGDEDGLGALAQSLSFTFVSREDGTPVLHIDGIDRSTDIRSPEISMGASYVSKYPAVRAALLDLQRKLGENGGVVLEGRDIGTVVFPDAEVKIFLTASPETRAKRRYDELVGKGVEADYEQTLAEVKERDHLDSVRPIAPLKPAADAVLVDTTALGMEAAVDKMVAIVRAKMTQPLG